MKEKPYIELDFAKLDIDRIRRCHLPEVILAKGKKAEQIALLLQKLYKHSSQENFALATKVTQKAWEEVSKILKKKNSNILPHTKYFQDAKLVRVGENLRRKTLGTVVVACAGTADIDIAEEASLVSEMLGNPTKRIYDIGVAGLQRLLYNLEEIREARVIIVVAGMDGALPAVLSGLVSVPILAVPTSVGYGASFQGLSPLLSMLNSCAPGVSVVNIDNGFGAAYQASLINSTNGIH